MTSKVASKEKRILDIASMLEKGMERKEIVQTLTKKCKVSARCIDNHIKAAKKIVAERNKQKEAVRVMVTEQTLTEELKEAIKSDLELEAILCTIATGNISVEEIIRGNAVLRGISPLEQIAAIDKLFRKRGVYIAKVAQTDSQGNDVLPILSEMKVFLTGPNLSNSEELKID
jgi:hypothetical protein